MGLRMMVAQIAATVGVSAFAFFWASPHCREC